MKIGLLSDAHGNLLGLKACLDFFLQQGIKKIYFLGDAVGYFPDNVPVIEMLLSCHAFCLLGNHDAMLLNCIEPDNENEELYQTKNAQNKIPSQYLRQMTTFLPCTQEKIEGERILFVHGSPWNPLSGYIYPDSDLKYFSGLPFDTIFMGHTHRPFLRQIGDLSIVNVGSCGLPRDDGAVASCVVYDSESKKSEIIRISLDIADLIERYGESIHPSVLNCLFRKNNNELVGRLIDA